MRFGMMSIPGSGLAAMAALREAEQAGFDVIASADHLRDPRDPARPVLDGWSVAAAWAVASELIRIAMLVSNLIYRNPVVLAKQAVTVDQLSNGRLDLGVGGGVFGTDHAMAGVPWWPPAERVARLADFLPALVAALDGASSYEGPFYCFKDASLAPGPVQPRLPLVIGAAGPRMLRLVAEFADTWSAFGGIGVTDESQFFGAMARQAQALETACEQMGRDPASLRRSLLAYRPLTPWASRDSLQRVIDSAARLGFDELIFYPPADDDERRVFGSSVTDVLPQHRTFDPSTPG
jgi:alkanesulfonate monooxygenase SsuD/methylene tetrahydromethanopterin reductase-like flavin-dependent oxidoreductase (luciferase family)